MFREDNKIYYRPSCTNTNHADTVTRQPKKKELLDMKMWDLRVARERLEKRDPSDSEKNKLKSQIRRLEMEITEIENTEIRHKSIHKRKKMKFERVFDYCKDAIITSMNANISFITAEDVAYQIDVPVYLVKQCFTEMNKLGWLSQSEHHYLHDSWRPNDSAWAADIYYIWKEKLLCACTVKEEQM